MREIDRYLPEVPEVTPHEEPWGYEGQMDRHAPIGDEDYWDNYPDDVDNPLFN